MRVEIAHELGEAEATRRLESMVDDLMRRDYKAARVKNAQRSWTGNELVFSFSVAKGFFETAISGRMTVSDRLVALDATVPGMVTAFLGEDRIREAIQRELGRVLA